MAKKTLQLAFAIVIFAAAIFIGYRSEQPAEKDLSVGFRPAEIDLGDRLWGQVIPVELALANDGDAPLTIVGAKSSCGCAVLQKDSYENRVVEAGSVLKVDLNLDTKKAPGEKLRTVKLVADTGAEYAVEIHLNVVATWRLTTDRVHFDDIVVGAGKDAITQSVEYESESDALIDIAIDSAPWLECNRGRQTDNRTELVIRVLPELMERGRNLATIALRTSSDVKPVASIVVTAIGIHELTAKPDPVALLFDDKRRVEFFDLEGRPVRIVSARVTDASLECAVLDDGAVEVHEADSASSTTEARLIVEDAEGRSRSVLISRF